MEDKVRSIVNEYLAPLVAKDGGVLELVEVEGNVVRLRLAGTCRGCPGQPLTLGDIIEPTLRAAVHADIHVETVP